ncbi:copper amine oxidase N-terminal domain-containing protein [Paenibacillus sp. N3.4]|uniref:copper amine oxidase N-terminal domain-containing protein n=1 Tax=Paenibacillus sp. N3.4 TaxID=2603222 RepID=UPI0011C7B986|nr:copper amine oxidase N-terminal domain-containing protein [Paenibacillus sp. N3.4]TXK76083.1 copper amine oxidase N-terminal domain-containing protein [Paenibacillus sp. N3.4]
MKKIRYTLIYAMLLILALTPAIAWADNAPASDKTINIQLKLGNDYITINDQAITVETPYVSKGATLVPLRVITTAFGATLSWDSETQTVGLKNGSTAISMKIGSMAAAVNGTEEQLEASPELKNGTTMVPLRFIAEKFGAKVGYDESTSSITITGNQSASTGSGDIDSDLGKTHIGNSFYGWSMKYPSGLVKGYESFQEDYVSFDDANGEFKISVSVESDMSENMSEDALLGLLADEVEEAVLEKKFVSEGKRAYALILSKADGKMYEYRAYQQGDKVYIIYFTIKKEENYKITTKYNAYKDLLDSFKLTFDASDKTLKDLSKVKDGNRKYSDETYGVSLTLPADWSKVNGSNEALYFADPKKQKGFSFA